MEGKEIESTDLEPISLGLLVIKKLGGKRMVQMAEYFADNSQIIVNGFVQSGLTGVQDGQSNEHDEQSDINSGTENDFYVIEFSSAD